MSTQDLQQRLARLNEAIQSGERTVTTRDGASVTYRSLDEMREARRELEGQLAPRAARQRAVVVRATFGTIRGG